MNRGILFLVPIMALACQEPPYKTVLATASEEVITQSEVHQIVHLWGKGMLENDPNKIDAVLHHSWMYSGSADGSTATKKRSLDGMTSGPSALRQFFLSDTLVRTYGDTAILTGREELVFVKGADTTWISLRFTDVFVKENGKLKAVSTHSSPIADQY